MVKHIHILVRKLPELFSAFETKTLPVKLHPPSHPALAITILLCLYKSDYSRHLIEMESHSIYLCVAYFSYHDVPRFIHVAAFVRYVH